VSFFKEHPLATTSDARRNLEQRFEQEGDTSWHVTDTTLRRRLQGRLPLLSVWAFGRYAGELPVLLREKLQCWNDCL
jgi:hypothetical protein